MTTGTTDASSGAHTHVVGFYADDGALLQAVVAGLGDAALAGHAVVVIATDEHADVVRAGLSAAGADLDTAMRLGSVVFLDAASTVDRLLVDGAVDAERFDLVIGGVVRAAAERSGRVHAYGEMVDVLWRAGDAVGAIELERLWNRLGEVTPLSLFCGYSAELVGGADCAPPYHEICSLHSHVVGGAPEEAAADATRRFPPNVHAPRLARAFVKDTLLEWHRRDDVDGCLMVVTELVTNAILHARSDCTVSLRRRPDGVRIVVGDANTETPVRRWPSPSVPGGRGLQLIESISHRWGHRTTDGGKLVWADVAATPERAR
jgi:hypothetical protein